jgi:hypothetical protein
MEVNYENQEFIKIVLGVDLRLAAEFNTLG